MNRRVFFAASLAASGFFGAVAAGCGGGSGGSGGQAPALTGRAAVVHTVQGTRRASGALALGFSNPQAEESQRVTRTVQAGLRAVKSGRQAEENPLESTGYDEEMGLYYRFQQTAGGFKLAYYKDEALTQAAGYIEFVTASDTEFAIIFRLSEGNEPLWGDINVTYTQPEQQSGRITGELRDPKTGEQIAFDLNFTDNETLTGALSLRVAGQIIALTDLTGQADGAMTANLSYKGSTGQIQQNADESGSLTLNTAEGQYRAQYDAAGRGTLTLPGGQVVTIADFDTEP